MSRPLVLLSLLVAAMAAIFSLANLAGEFVVIMIIAAVILLGIGVLTGR